MIDAEESQLLRRMIHPAALAALRTEGRFRSLSERVLAPSRPGLDAARKAVADVLLAVAPERVKRFEHHGVMYFDLGSAELQSELAREVWETLCDRLDLPWLDEPTRRFLDHSTHTWQSRDGDRVRVHRKGASGAVEVHCFREDDLIASEDPMSILRAVDAQPMWLAHPPTLSAVVSITSAHPSVALAEALAWEAVHGSTRGMRKPPVIVWRVEDRARLFASRHAELSLMRRGVAAMEEWAEQTGAWRRFDPSVPCPFEAVLAIYETGMILDAITPERISLVCPSTR